MSRPVLDMTGLKGFYSFTMTFAPDEAPAAPTDGIIAESSVGPSHRASLCRINWGCAWKRAARRSIC